MPTVKLTVEYDGTAYAGWQRQPDQRTIQAAIEDALLSLTRSTIPVIAAGRTDAGVHAAGQVISFRCDETRQPADWTRAMNAVLPSDIAVLTAVPAPDNFHARYGAIRKHYQYRILARRERSAFEHHRAWHVWGQLDVEAMHRAAAPLLGSHDFSSFEGPRSGAETSVCSLTRLEVSRAGQFVLIDVEADRFLKQMVRTIVGTLVEIGQKKRDSDAMRRILAARDRRAAGYTAPPHGLYLMRVDY